MQKAITLLHRGKTLRGMEHFPDYPHTKKVPAVILFHGFTGMKLEPHRMFLKISRALEKMGYASFRFDFLGSGESDGDFEEMTVSNEVSEAKAILDYVWNDPRIDCNSIGVIGFSMGGVVASILAGDRPEDITHLVLIAPAGNMYEIVKNHAELFDANPELKVADYGGNMIGREFISDLRKIDVYGRAKNYRGKVLLIHGTEDETVPCHVSYEFQKLSYGSQASVHIIEGADHTFNKHKWEFELIQKICSAYNYDAKYKITT